MASGETTPFSNTLAPSRVTSRSSCSTFSSCCWTRAIFNRQELEPMSIAAYVCIFGGVLPGKRMLLSAMQDTPLLLHLFLSRALAGSDTPVAQRHGGGWAFTRRLGRHPLSQQPSADA